MSERKYSALLILLAFVFFSCNPPDEEVVYDYSLVDINPNSDTTGENISPDYFDNQVTLHYFGHQGWGLCQTRVGNLDDLYTNLLDSSITNVKIIAIGKSAENSSNAEWTDGNKIPVVLCNNGAFAHQAKKEILAAGHACLEVVVPDGKVVTVSEVEAALKVAKKEKKMIINAKNNI